MDAKKLIQFYFKEAQLIHKLREPYEGVREI
jgi:hypothetical protein